MEFIDSPSMSEEELVANILEIVKDYDNTVSQSLTELRESVHTTHAVAERIAAINTALEESSLPHLEKLIKGLGY